MDYDTVAELIALNGGKLVGRTRLQKSVYLLQACGINLGFDFDYHHYGPFSEELATAALDAEALGMVDVEWKMSYGNEYAIFKSNAPISDFPDFDKAGEVLKVLGKYEATVLELAATADFLRKNGYGSDAWEETRRRKASKITPQRLEQSKALLHELQALH
ncbi:hypothetical protein [Bradyrhizobium sp. ORS 111]|uniref:hypothetical protein n=1 Tax=Bradyrhizobium sp. ORS 111 TaxID=1685958 RepID=UPI00388ED1A5